jgi:NAD(P)-dependent dehydrogenase (short-subunit alcohol dehydrogenase family)
MAVELFSVAQGSVYGTNSASDRKIAPSAKEVLERLQQGVERAPLSRPGAPEELKKIATYLASDAASYTKGQVFVVDGGIS